MSKNDIHPIQGEILCQMLFVETASFSELNKRKLPSDQFSFHLRQLTDLKYLEKNILGKYLLTTKGKEYANTFDTDKAEIEKQAKIGALIVGNKVLKGKKYFLMQQRLKQPYYGFWGFITGKIKWGETIEEGAQREFKEETGMVGNMELAGLKHKMDYNQKSELLEDKYFLLIRASKLRGKLTEEFEGGRNKWLTLEEIRNLPDLFDGVEETIKMSLTKKLDFSEIKYRVKRY
ncbi:MAG: NUDIX hydrolase [Candidatus Shapirobacteria bacterium]|jgi:8-oxo-dGTP pyrophosphatase MutT (NUDIX family)